jgi:hypothetical protein
MMAVVWPFAPQALYHDVRPRSTAKVRNIDAAHRCRRGRIDENRGRAFDIVSTCPPERVRDRALAPERRADAQ